MRIYISFEAVLAREVRKPRVEAIRTDTTKWIQMVGQTEDGQSPEPTALT